MTTDIQKIVIIWILLMNMLWMIFCMDKKKRQEEQ